ncbi:hypothetical protein VP01_2878g1 [Puccinia sorghi]|uniref:Uncharacterized protein n=1 Tax=Puccinia sorghi TaxID=27349 RepID=A0A0L6V1S2_9BASI|nr:hypothetical protein VP01_2878g1 [Puccinia sorghi]
MFTPCKVLPGFYHSDLFEYKNNKFSTLDGGCWAICLQGLVKLESCWSISMPIIRLLSSVLNQGYLKSLNFNHKNKVQNFGRGFSIELHFEYHKYPDLLMKANLRDKTEIFDQNQHLSDLSLLMTVLSISHCKLIIIPSRTGCIAWLTYHEACATDLNMLELSAFRHLCSLSPSISLCLNAGVQAPWTQCGLWREVIGSRQTRLGMITRRIWGLNVLISCTSVLHGLAAINSLPHLSAFPNFQSLSTRVRPAMRARHLATHLALAVLVAEPMSPAVAVDVMTCRSCPNATVMTSEGLYGDPQLCNEHWTCPEGHNHGFCSHTILIENFRCSGCRKLWPKVKHCSSMSCHYFCFFPSDFVLSTIYLRCSWENHTTRVSRVELRLSFETQCC